ncbi:FAD:protein FMN transferase [Kiritimatiellaeota bacterium B1221]|nr:FAD:protein FMN transferase [Kiritimatiellaeota bacterium B1221]
MLSKESKFFLGMLLVLAGIGVWLAQSPMTLKHKSAPVTSFEGETMGTTYEVKISGTALSPEESAVLQTKVEQELLAVNVAMSTYISESEISRFNRLAEGDVFPVSERFREVLVRSFEIYEQSNRSFDPTLGPLINLWGFGEAGEKGEGPSEVEIQEVLNRVGMKWLELSDAGLSKIESEVEINLSAIAKGYGVDRVAEVLMREGYEDIYVEIGGELLCRGVNGFEIPWRIGVQVPAMDAAQQAMQVVALEDQGLATSGDYRNYVVDDAGLRHHILDPRTGRPAKHTLASVSVLAEDCMTADAVATALFVMGTEEGMAWVEAQEGLEALFIDRGEDGYKNTATDGFKAAMIAVP